MEHNHEEDARYGEARAADRRAALRPVRSVQALRRHDPRQDFVFAFESEMCVCAIAELLGMTQSAISHQLKILKDANLVANRREGKTIYYFLSDDHVRTIIAKGFEHLIEERNENNEEDL